MSEHACLLAARFYDPFGQTDSSHSTTRQAYRRFLGGVTRACGRVASLCGVDSYHFGAVMVGCSILALIAGVA